MKHCAKKLLGLAFALALCLAVGGTALAETPVLAEVSDTLPEQEMLAYEPYAAPAAEGMNTVDKFATEGYTVTIPTTVTVNSGENKGELEVNAKLKQYRTLNIGIASQDDKWTLKYQGTAAGTTTPEVGYKLSESGKYGTSYQWYCDPTLPKPQLVFAVGQPSAGISGADALNWYQDISAKIPITVPTPSQATMSGTYSDTLTFTFNLDKQCVTYIINVYHQEMQLTGYNFSQVDNAPNYQALKMVDKVGTDGRPIDSAQPDEVYTLEYGFALNEPVGNPSNTWTRPRTGQSVSEEEDTRCWEDLTYDLNLQDNYNNDNKDIVVNLNLVRKWYWLDVNGITDKASCADREKDGNQGGRIASFVNIRVSADGGTNWSGWYWYRYGDDYWGTFPYGTEFQLGLHRVKDGYAYDADTAGNVAIYANGNVEYTQDGTVTSPDGQTHYRVYQGKLEGAPVDAALYNTNEGGNVHEGAGGKALPRYCYNVCFVDGITYYANGGTGGREDTNLYHREHTSFKYTAGMKLAEPETTDGCAFTAPEGKVFAGWSTTPDYTAGQVLYAPGTPESEVKWPARPSTSNHDTLPTTDGQTVCRTLYAIWGYDITVQFEDEKGYSTNDGRGPVATLGGTMDNTTYSFTLKGQAVDEDKGWTLDLTDTAVKDAIDDATTEAKRAAGDNRATTTSDDVWKTDIEYKLSAAEVKRGKPVIIRRRRYLLSVISVKTDTGYVLGVDKNPNKDEYGTFKIIVNNNSTSDLSDDSTSFYQKGLNYGASYTVSNPSSVDSALEYSGRVILQSLAVGNRLGWEVTQDNIEITESYRSCVTGKKTDVHYYTPSDPNPDPVYTGDPVRVAFWLKPTTGSTTPMPGPSLAPAKKALTLRYHANFDPTEELALDLDPDPLLEDMDDTFGFDPDPLPEDVDDALEEAVKTVRYQPGEDVVLRNCMFKRGGYVFVGWNTEPDGTGKKYEVNGVPITDWAAGDTVDLYAQWKKPEHLKPVVDSEPFVPADPDTPPERIDDGFDADFGADPDPQPEELDDAFGADPAAQPDALDDAFGVDPAAQPEALDDAFGIDPDPLPEELDDAFGV